MKMRDIRQVFPEAGRIIWRLVDAGRINGDDVEGLSVDALARIDQGATPEPDLVKLLDARAAMRRRQAR
jgi:hypothetical protein